MFRRILIIPSVFLCFLLCSCATFTTWNKLGTEVFVWKPEDLKITLQDEKEPKKIILVRNGTLKRYLVPFDFFRKFPSEQKTAHSQEIAVPEQKPFFAVTSSRSGRFRAKHFGKDVTQFPWGMKLIPPGFSGEIKPALVHPDDFKYLQKPFWKFSGQRYLLYVPEKPIRQGDHVLIPVTEIHPGGETWKYPGTERFEYYRRIETPLMTTYRIFCCIPAVVLDAATLPLQFVLGLMMFGHH